MTRQCHARHKGHIELGRPGGDGWGFRRYCYCIGISHPWAGRIVRPSEIGVAQDTEQANNRRHSRVHSSPSHGTDTMFFDELGSRNLRSVSLSSMVSEAIRVRRCETQIAPQTLRLDVKVNRQARM